MIGLKANNSRFSGYSGFISIPQPFSWYRCCYCYCCCCSNLVWFFCCCRFYCTLLSVYLFAYEIYLWYIALVIASGCCCIFFSIHSVLNVYCIPNMIDWHMLRFCGRFSFHFILFLFSFYFFFVDLSIVIWTRTIKRNILYK